jgi:hypothetical protein
VRRTPARVTADISSYQSSCPQMPPLSYLWVARGLFYAACSVCDWLAKEWPIEISAEAQRAGGLVVVGEALHLKQPSCAHSAPPCPPIGATWAVLSTMCAPCVSGMCRYRSLLLETCPRQRLLPELYPRGGSPNLLERWRLRKVRYTTRDSNRRCGSCQQFNTRHRQL